MGKKKKKTQFLRRIVQKVERISQLESSIQNIKRGTASKICKPLPFCYIYVPKLTLFSESLSLFVYFFC